MPLFPSRRRRSRFVLKISIAFMIAFTLFVIWKDAWYHHGKTASSASATRKAGARRSRRSTQKSANNAWKWMPTTEGTAVSFYDALSTPDAVIDGPEDTSGEDPEEREFMARFRKDWGRDGRGVYLSGPEKVAADKQYSKAGFNVYLSDRIPLNRTLFDNRPRKCLVLTYPKDLPSVSVVITFYNEILSALLRTVYSIVNRSPPRILREIVLVDDFSDLPEVKSQLYRFLRRHFRPGFIRLLRLSQREGLIRARLAGAKAALGDVIVFLDSHCEVFDGWLEPLVTVVSDDPTTIASPVITIINDQSFLHQKRPLRGGKENEMASDTSRQPSLQGCLSNGLIIYLSKHTAFVNEPNLCGNRKTPGNYSNLENQQAIPPRQKPCANNWAAAKAPVAVSQSQKLLLPDYVSG
ncbi:hypothetical protein HPB49_024183 [Dermacentor silvarum]|uniref:Uncharacterized protein n=1 Tax=Dermacentor silvarum TaxID=543639 RepID=A0ACB8DH02_DERSI|nr:hypothetical protein HPB49_024183 [Dermacentor silvarum]